MNRMRLLAIGVTLLALVAPGCGAGESPPTSAGRAPDFCCDGPNCCGVRYLDADGGVHSQACQPPLASTLPPIP